MNFFFVGTVFIALVAGAQVESSGVPELHGLPEAGFSCVAEVIAAIEEYRFHYEGRLKESPKMTDPMKTVSGIASKDTAKTKERKVFNNTDEMGQETGKKTVVEKTTETDVKSNGTVSKTLQTTIDVDEDGKQRGENLIVPKVGADDKAKNKTESKRTEQRKEILPSNITNDVVKEKEELLPSQESTNVTSVEERNITEKDDGLEKAERTEQRKEILASNITNDVVKEKEELLPSQESTNVTSVEERNVTEKDDGLEKAERTEQRKEILASNITNEIVVKEKEELLPSQESTKVTSVEEKNITEKSDGKDVEKETVIQKEVQKNVCNSDIKEVRNEKHLNETIEDLKHQVDDVKNKMKEEKAKAEETNAVVEKTVPAVTPAKVVRKDVPSVGEGKDSVVTRVVEPVTPSVVAEKVPVVTNQTVAEKIPPTVTEGKVHVVKEDKVIEKVVPSVTEEKLPVVTKEKVVEQAAPSVTQEIRHLATL
ncbi:uncharacterized protein LOC126981164 [Eriocheir sinensis]|uniref:uncharacterized protein LOC126981164 n=1 Tax=Eriocheir sinensis TaxID=95602 RepID=UPI0021C9648D|nr:uncharacterized protein LOC126981164 [Eriocheir sinensis]